jgi:hypothetical protein
VDYSHEIGHNTPVPTSKINAAKIKINAVNRIVQRNSVPPVLYHYTNATGLIGIASSLKLWATDVRYLNDASEYSYAKNMALEKLREIRCRVIMPPHVQELDETICKLESLYQPLFVFSLSPDGNQLSQWRCYGKPNDAYAIGFRGRSLWALTQRRRPQYRGLRLGPVVYDYRNQIEVLNAIELDAGIYNNKYGGQYADHYVARFLRSVAFIKHCDFHEEQEWRIAAHIERATSSIVKQRPRGSGSVPYIEIPFTRSSIVDIVMGPLTSTPVLNRGDVLELRRQHNLRCQITTSETPYRAL